MTAYAAPRIVAIITIAMMSQNSLFILPYGTNSCPPYDSSGLSMFFGSSQAKFGSDPYSAGQVLRSLACNMYGALRNAIVDLTCGCGSHDNRDGDRMRQRTISDSYSNDVGRGRGGTNLRLNSAFSVASFSGLHQDAGRSAIDDQ